MLKKVFLFLVLYFSSFATDSYVTCLFLGQMGNQMYEIATTLAYAWDYNMIPVFPDLNQNNFRLSYNRDKIFFRLNTSHPPHPFKHVFTESVWHSSERVPYAPDLILRGFFQSWKHFDHHREKIKEVFEPSPVVMANLNRKYGDLLASPKTVALHIRCVYMQDIKGFTKKHPFMGLDYIKNAMKLFAEDALYVVFSDRINFCKRFLSQIPDRKFVFIEGNDGVDDFFLMSRMKHIIMSNSTFSWWAAYLNPNPDKIVVCPEYIQHPEYYYFPLKQPNDYYLPEWIVVPVNLDEPTPDYMTWYDVSQSVNN